MPHPKTFFIRPASGLRLADPETGEYLPEAGALMPRSSFWIRRCKDGDVVEFPTNSPASLPGPVNTHAAAGTPAQLPKTVKGKKE